MGRNLTREEKLNELLQLSIRHGLNFEYSGHIGQISIRKYVSVDDFYQRRFRSEGYIKNWQWQTPDEVIDRITQEVMEYVNGNKVVSTN